MDFATAPVKTASNKKIILTKVTKGGETTLEPNVFLEASSYNSRGKQREIVDA